MRLNDRDNSTVAMYYIYCMHEVPPQQKDDGTIIFKMKTYSTVNKAQWFEYDDQSVMRKDMEYIDKWIHIKEMNSLNLQSENTEASNEKVTEPVDV